MKNSPVIDGKANHENQERWKSEMKAFRESQMLVMAESRSSGKAMTC
jgi:hypothetical protein